jgi:hypothetical protein
MPVPLRLSEYAGDAAQISKGVVVLQSGWQRTLENNSRSFAEDFVKRSRFVAAYPVTMTPVEFVDQLFTNGQIPIGRWRSCCGESLNLAGPRTPLTLPPGRGPCGESLRTQCSRAVTSIELLFSSSTSDTSVAIRIQGPDPRFQRFQLLVG